MDIVVRYRSKIFITLLVTFLIASLIFGSQKLGDNYQLVTRNIRHDQKLIISNRELNVQISKNDSEFQRGLSGVDELRENEAMLFVSDSRELDCFWMKDMKFDIDILWFDSSKKLIHTEKSVSPSTYPNLFCSDQPTPYVLETKSGFIERNKLNLDDEFKLLED